MATPQIQVNNRTLFRMRILDQDRQVLDISAATTLEMIFVDPASAKTTQTATLTTDGTDGRMEWRATANFLSTAGAWKRQGHIVIGGLDYYTDIKSFDVASNL